MLTFAPNTPQKLRIPFAVISLGLLGTMMASCANVDQVKRQTASTKETLSAARVSGADHCAPRELALAESHMQFAQQELDEGDSVRAVEHIELALMYAESAQRLSPYDRCGPIPPDTDKDGYPDKEDQCPEQPEDFDTVADEDGCPEDQDTDGDSIPDSVDLCVLIAEDVDGYLDNDGCPEPDNDLDGIADNDDKCRNQPEDIDDWRDEDGCPEPDNDGDTVVDVEDQCPSEPGAVKDQGCPVYENVRITTTHIHILQKIYFKTNKATIRDISFPILKTVAKVLADYPNINLEVQGHTDSRGSNRYNQKLSDARAASVRQFLIEQGVDPERLLSKGYGEDRPIESNRTSAGRAANRRVEFVRTDKESSEKAPEEEDTL